MARSTESAGMRTGSPVFTSSQITSAGVTSRSLWPRRTSSSSSLMMAKNSAAPPEADFWRLDQLSSSSMTVTSFPSFFRSMAASMPTAPAPTTTTFWPQGFSPASASGAQTT